MSNAKQKEDFWIKSKLDEAGAEIMDPKPLFERIGFKKPPTMEQKLQQYLANERQMMRDEMNIDPEEELNFEIDDDPDLLSPYEAEVMIMEEEQLDIEQAIHDREIAEKENEEVKESPDTGDETELHT